MRVYPCFPHTDLQCSADVPSAVPIHQSKSGVGLLHRGFQTANECRSMSVNENLKCRETTPNVTSCEGKNKTPGKDLCQCSQVQGMAMGDLHIVHLASYQWVCASRRSGHFTPRHPPCWTAINSAGNYWHSSFFSPTAGTKTEQGRRSSLRLSTACCDPHHASHTLGHAQRAGEQELRVTSNKSRL